MDSTLEQARKKPYSTPRLVVYGDIREITQNSAQKNMADNPPANMQS